MNAPTTILTVNNLNAYHTDTTPVARESENGKRTKRTKRHQILFDVSFTMQTGEILALVGESGSGKSTLVKTILGINQDYTGEIHNYCDCPQMIFQDPYSSLNPARKVGWILEEPLRITVGYPKKERRENVLMMLNKVGLDESLVDRYPHQLSGGQRQRVAIAAALIKKPQLLIADEPVSALDVTIQAQILDLLKKLHREMGLSIIFISHNLLIVQQMCERILIMKQGIICEQGNRDDIFNNPQSEYTKKLLMAAGIGKRLD